MSFFSPPKRSWRTPIVVVHRASRHNSSTSFPSTAMCVPNSRQGMHFLPLHVYTHTHKTYICTFLNLPLSLFSVRPLTTTLLWDASPLTADREYEIRCQTVGAQPSAVVSWWINGDIRLKSYIDDVSMYGAEEEGKERRMPKT